MPIEGHQRVVKKLSISELKDDLLKRGLTRKEIAKKYDLPIGQIIQALEQTGLSKIRPKKIMFEIVDDTKKDDNLPEDNTPYGLNTETNIND